MSNPFHIQSETNNFIQRFTATGSWISFIKPDHVSILYFFMISGGSGGGGGMTGATSTLRGGGGGGACSAITRLLIPAIFLPDRLYIWVGSGGAGGAATVNGSSGEASFISTEPDFDLSYQVLGSNVPTGGTAGTTVAGAAGVGAAVFSRTRYSLFGNLNSTAGTNGVVGSTSTGGNITPSTSIMLTGGSGGGGANASNSQGAGGVISASGIYTIITGGTSSGGNGNPGLFISKPFTATGGTGGGGSAAGIGGNGGNGSYGCGGGAGGGGITGGTGGRGGDGLIYVIGW